MTDAQAQADLEQAPGMQLNEDAGRPTRADGQPHPPESKNDIMAEKVIVFSFRNLQLKRIGALQDELMALSLVKEPLQPDHDDRVDKVLKNYGEQLYIQPPWMCSTIFSNISTSASTEELRNSFSERSPRHSYRRSLGRQHGNRR